MKQKIVVPTLVLIGGILSAQGANSPRLIPFQGRLADSMGKAVADGESVIQFKIYDSPVAGKALWNGEVQKLTVNGGLVSTLLGTKAALSGVDFNQQIYLEITIDANGDRQITLADPPLLPRQSILPAVFAVEAADARKLAGHDWSALLVSGNNPETGHIRGDRIQAKGITSAQLADNIFNQNVNSKARTYEIYGGGLSSYKTINPQSNVMLSSLGNDQDSWIFKDFYATDNWGIYHRNIDSSVEDLPANSIGFIGGGNSAAMSWINLGNGDGFFRGNLSVDSLTARSGVLGNHFTLDHEPLGDYRVVNPKNVFLSSPPNDTDAWIYRDRDTTSNWGIYHRQIDSQVHELSANSIGFIGGGDSTTKAVIDLVTGDFSVRRNVYASAFNNHSDERLKTNIQSIEDPLKKIMALKGIHFNWKTDTNAATRPGLIAQEVHKIIPSIVGSGLDGMMTVDYSAIVPLLIEGLKEQQKQIDELRSQIQPR